MEPWGPQFEPRIHIFKKQIVVVYIFNFMTSETETAGLLGSTDLLARQVSGPKLNKEKNKLQGR